MIVIYLTGVVVGKGGGGRKIQFSVIIDFEFDRVGKSQCLGEYKCTVAPVLAQL